MSEFEFCAGMALLIAVVIGLAAAYCIHFMHVMRDDEDERVDELADIRVDELLENAEVHVHQQLLIVCGQGYDK